MSSETGWCTIESDPAIFSELIEELGVTGLSVEEIWDLDPAGLAHLGHIYGLIFLFKWTPTELQSEATKDTYLDLSTTNDESIFFAKQVIQNACATQAILSILMNLPQDDKSVQLGPALTEFKEFTAEFDPEMKGMVLGEHEMIRKVHNGFGRPEALYIDEATRNKDQEKDGEDPFHFVTIMPIGSTLVVKLDGLKPAPIVLNDNLDVDWTLTALKSIKAHIALMQASSEEIRFNLMAVIRDPEIPLLAQLSSLDDSNEWQRTELTAILEDIRGKRARRREEVRLRRHNFVPLIMGILECMAKRRPDLLKN